jgi:SAM-dependent methyltransferase
MKRRAGLAEFKFIETLEMAKYSAVANEYYNPELHPTCADFRSASVYFLRRAFLRVLPSGRIADIGCGESLLAKFIKENLVLIDESEEMLDRNFGTFEKRCVDIVLDAFGSSEFDWIFAILGDPFNVDDCWRHISIALKEGGRCVFVVPSHEWAIRFRRAALTERSGYARFELARGETVYLPSFIYSERDQASMIAEAGLKLQGVDHVYLRDIEEIKSPKVSEYLSDSDPLLDIYSAEK